MFDIYRFCALRPSILHHISPVLCRVYCHPCRSLRPSMSQQISTSTHCPFINDFHIRYVLLRSRSLLWAQPMCGSRGGMGIRTPPPPFKNHKNIGFLSNTRPDPLKNHKATKPAFNIGPSSTRQRNAI